MSTPPPPPPSYPPGPSPYGAAPGPYGGGGSAGPHPQGTTILVLGILSLLICGLLGPVAFIMGNNALKEIDAAPARYSNRGQVQAGRICGIIASAFLVIAIIALIALASS